MGFLRSRGRKDAASLALRDTLFGDAPLGEWPPAGAAAEGFPWSAFTAARSHLAAGSVEEAKRCWREVVAKPGLEPRHYLQAWHFLREQGEQPPAEVAQQVLGVVVENHLRDGLDVLAVYADRSVRYLNHAGGGVVLERAEGSLAELVDALLEAAAPVVAQIGPWEEPRPGPPPRDHTRLSFLTPSGLHFGQAPAAVLFEDPAAGPLLRVATAILTELVETATAE